MILYLLKTFMDLFNSNIQYVIAGYIYFETKEDLCFHDKFIDMILTNILKRSNQETDKKEFIKILSLLSDPKNINQINIPYYFRFLMKHKMYSQAIAFHNKLYQYYSPNNTFSDRDKNKYYYLYF